MALCLISFGANIGNPLDAIRAASDQLQRRLVATGALYQLSRFFRTPPIGGPAGQPPFINAVAALHTQSSPIEVWDTIREVEQQLGRQRDRRWEARRIDLDILLYDDLRIWTPLLKIPHPRMCMRRFILIPALDVAPDWIDPVSQWSIAQLAGRLQSGAGSLVLVSDNASAHAEWLPEIAKQSLAQVVSWGQSRVTNQSRWVSLTGFDEFEGSSLSKANQQLEQAKLAMFVTSDASDAGAAAKAIDWETRHHFQATQLRLIDRPGTASMEADIELTFTGPRYLLASQDSQWAIHEVVSALEAMDCPVEPLVEGPASLAGC